MSVPSAPGAAGFVLAVARNISRVCIALSVRFVAPLEVAACATFDRSYAMTEVRRLNVRKDCEGLPLPSGDDVVDFVPNL